MKFVVYMFLVFGITLLADDAPIIDKPDYTVGKKDGESLRKLLIGKKSKLFIFPNPANCTQLLQLLDEDKNVISTYDMYKANALIYIAQSGSYYVKVVPRIDCKVSVVTFGIK